MILDYYPATSAFTLRVPRGEADPRAIMTEHGWDFSEPKSTQKEALLFTRDPYAAAVFSACATPAAMGQIASIVSEVALSWKAESNANIRCPADQELWAFQKADIEYALRRKNTLVGDQPGLGKTPVAICFCNEVSAKRVLVLCPANIRLQWARKIREWSTMRWPYVVYPILNGGRGVHPLAEWTVVSYDLARTPAIGAALAKGNYDVLILDEAHALKTFDAKRTRAVFGDHTGDYRKLTEDGGHEVLFTALASRCERILALTGTPLPNRPREAYTLARGLCFRADTRILTSNGIRAIIDVKLDDLLWDGVEWVAHGGVVYQGQKMVLERDGTAATANHQVLSGAQWFPWSAVMQDGDIRSRALETGLESIRSLAMHLAKAERISSFDALVDRHLARLSSIIYGTELRPVASTATINASLDLLLNSMATLKSSPTASAGVLCSDASLEPSPAVTIPLTKDISGTAQEASAFGPRGARIENNFSHTLLPSQGGMTQSLNSTGKTIVVDTNLEIYDLSQSMPTGKTGELLPVLNSKLLSLKPVYDIMNAGPRHRFTIVSEAGPMVVSNCFDAIDWMSEDSFKERFNPSALIEGQRSDGSWYKYKREEAGRHGELQNRLRANFMVRHLKHGPDGVMKHLKLPVYDIVLVDETKAVKAALEAESMLHIDFEDPDFFRHANDAVMGDLAAVRHMMGVAKAPLVAAYVEMILEGGEDKVCVFGWHIEVLNILQRALSKYGVVRIDGSTSATMKEKIVLDFQKKPELRVCIGNMQSMGVGTDGLHNVCSHAVFAESSWVDGENQQCVDRLDRGSQTRTVLADFMVAPGSIDERVLSSSLRKGRETFKVLDRRAI